MTFTNHKKARRRERPILTTLYHIHPLYDHLDINQVIIAENSFLHIVSQQTNKHGIANGGTYVNTDVKGNKSSNRCFNFHGKKDVFTYSHVMLTIADAQLTAFKLRNNVRVKCKI